LADDWRRLDGRIDELSAEIQALADADSACERLIWAGYPSAAIATCASCSCQPLGSC
jgi:hypothetical protein